MTEVILGIDPGLHIGYAVLGVEERRILESGMILSSDLSESILSDFKLIRPLYHPVIPVIEKFPQIVQEDLASIREQLLRYFPRAISIAPGVYLPVMHARPKIPFVSSDIHAFEAALLAYYYLIFKHSRSEGAL